MLSTEILNTIKNVKQDITNRVNAHDARLAALERAIEARDKRAPSLNWKGIWNDRELYPEGVTCTSGGSLWLAKSDSIARKPGTDGGAASWVLIVKEGADGRDAAGASR